ncbi:hypothetical protein I302_104677 [Kwoniella bestiolae CBS 10118]|uniref:Chromo domain-containing protein n=1 Tax=Kwoniella bestiolae CBS 10118 TaxID=1296100 RepID=A0A1B9FS32_9TREE|nr:hypothetical protein I302_09254 [Kwoniella bestiolae CBS 10118]OCF21575.1 hypothetical protein I302_09254 [Kwoniella bestiolae CBS 10118]
MARTTQKRAAAISSTGKRAHDDLDLGSSRVPYPTPSAHENDDLCSLNSYDHDTPLLKETDKDKLESEEEDELISADEGVEGNLGEGGSITFPSRTERMTSVPASTAAVPPSSIASASGREVRAGVVKRGRNRRSKMVSQGTQTDDTSFVSIIIPTTTSKSSSSSQTAKNTETLKQPSVPNSTPKSIKRPRGRPRKTKEQEKEAQETQIQAETVLLDQNDRAHEGEGIPQSDTALPEEVNQPTLQNSPDSTDQTQTTRDPNHQIKSKSTPRINPMKEPATLLPQGYQPVQTTVDNHWVYLFFRFCAERHKMYNRRREGVTRDQLTEDDTMSRRHIGNVFRQLDPSSKNIKENIIGRGDQSPEEVCFRLFLYCMFYSESTWSELCKVATGGLPTWKHYLTDMPAYEAVLYRMSMVEKKRIYYGGFQIVPPTIYFTDNRNRNKDMAHFAASLRLVLAMMSTSLPSKLTECSYAVDASYLLQTIPTFGGFLSLNVICFLNDTSNFTWYYRNFATCGPGPRSFLRRMFGGKSVINNIAMEEAGLIWLYENQWKYWARIGEDPPQADELGLRPGMRVLDIENALCWCHRYVDAYERKGYGNLSQLPDPQYDREMTDDTHEPHWCVEERWMKSTSKVIYKDDLDEISRKLGHVEDREEDVYEVEKIVTRRQGAKLKDGWYRVRWKGYTPAEDTWERESSIREGAEESLQEWKDWERTVWDCIDRVKKEYPYVKPPIPKEDQEVEVTDAHCKVEIDDELESLDGNDLGENEDEPPNKRARLVKQEME